MFLKLAMHNCISWNPIGYNVETATNEHIKKQYGQNACAGCVGYGMDVGVGQIGQVASQVQADVEVSKSNPCPFHTSRKYFQLVTWYLPFLFKS